MLNSKFFLFAVSAHYVYVRPGFDMSLLWWKMAQNYIADGARIATSPSFFTIFSVMKKQVRTYDGVWDPFMRRQVISWHEDFADDRASP